MKSDPTTTVLIIGCGWLGQKLGHRLSEEGYDVTGTTRSQSNFSELRKAGIRPRLLDVSLNPQDEMSIPAADHIFISISPGRGENRDQYPLIIDRLAKSLKKSGSHALLFSSTSVYSGCEGETLESYVSPDPESPNAILSAEGFFHRSIPTGVILRFGGLYGPDRHPVNYLAGRSGIADGDAPVNLIHSEDCVQICHKIIEQEISGEVFNACAPEHPSRKELYTRVAKEKGLEIPSFKSGGKNGKRISSSKLIRKLNYHFLHPDPMIY